MGETATTTYIMHLCFLYVSIMLVEFQSSPDNLCHPVSPNQCITQKAVKINDAHPGETTTGKLLTLLLYEHDLSSG
jgi:hypothetical protein